MQKNPVTSNLISASAGTGKTYKLASRFISLLALDYPAERLIALTFTRNAAGEFKSNILKAIALGAETPEKAEELTQRILSTLHGTKAGEVPLCPQGADVSSLKLEQAGYRDMLKEIIRKLPQLNLSTLDSFFSKLVGTNCMKLGYPSVEQMENAVVEKARKTALNAMLQDRAEKNEEALLELLRDVSGEAKNTLEALESNVASYYDEYQKTQPDAEQVWGALEPFGFTNKLVLDMLETALACPMNKVMEDIQKILDDAEGKILSKLEAIEASGKKLHSHGKRHSDIISCCRGLVKKLRKGDGSVNLTTGKWLYDNTSTCQDSAELRQLVRNTRDIAVLLPAALKTRAILSFLRQYDKRYQDDIKASGKLVFADMPRLVADKLLNGEDLGAPANIAYRLDGQLDHWMLDEFQDTAPEQWRALKVLLEQIRDEAQGDSVHHTAERSIFVVGDEKQSIYGWRGGTPELFSYLAEGKDGWNVLQCTQQNESFRSADAIMGEAREVDGVSYGFVNDLFLHLPGMSPAKSAEFTRHNIAAVNRDKVGYACVEKMTPEQGAKDDLTEEMCQRMAEVLVKEVDFANKDLSAAILVRTNGEVHDICRCFERKYPDIPVVSLTDEPLSSASLLGELFLHFFKWMQYPNNAFSENMLLHSPLCVRESAEETPTKAWNRLRRLIDNKGYAASLLQLTHKRQNIKKDRAFREWINEARAFDAKGGTLDEWVLYMSHLVSKASAPKSCVHVMTFHKSKGLGYDVVLMPFSTTKSAVRSTTLFYKEVYRNKDTEEMLGLLVNPGVKDENVSASPYFQLAQRWQREQLMEALNMLYVAVTRAKLANYIFINVKKKEKPKSADSLSLSFSEMLDFAFAGRFSEEQKVEWGNPRWAEYAKPKKTEPDAEPEIQKPTHTYRRRVSPSKIDTEHTPKNVTVGAAYEEPRADEPGVDAAAFGTEVHALFEEVEWLGQGVPPRWLSRPESESERLVSAALHVPEVRALYTRQPGQVAYNEQSIDAIEVRSGDEVWVSGTLDRLVLTQREKKVTEAHIIDFKTDLRRGESPAEQDAHLCKTHRAQMRAYHTLLSRAFPGAAVHVTLVSCPRDGAPARVVPLA